MRQKPSSTALCGPDRANARALVKALRAAGFTACLRNKPFGGDDCYTVTSNCVGEQLDAIWDAIPMSSNGKE